MKKPNNRYVHLLNLEEDKWLKGWAAITRYTGFKDPRSVIRMKDQYGLPLRTLPDGTSVIVISELNEWLRAFTEASSPFRIRRLTGASLDAENGILRGAVKRARDSFFEKKGPKLSLEWDLDTKSLVQGTA